MKQNGEELIPRNVRILGLGAKMPRARFQRPRIKRRGARGREYWIAEFHRYSLVDGVEKRRHYVQEFGLCSTTTRPEAQQRCDRFMESINGQSSRPDAALTVTEFWETIYLPGRAARWAYNTRINTESNWRCHIAPALGPMRLDAVLKHHVEQCLITAARKGIGKVLLDRLNCIVHDIFEEAVENEYLTRNPARKVKAPAGKVSKSPRSLDEAEVSRLLAVTDGEERLMWAVLVLTGARLGEMLALTRADIVPAGLRIDKSALLGKPGPTKNRKARIALLPAELRADLLAHIGEMPANQVLLFPNPDDGTMRIRNQDRTKRILVRARAAAGIDDLTWRMCRTTFATLFIGDISDIQAILGHATPQFTAAVYRRSQQERAQRSVEGLAARVVPIRRPA